jgi:hypothetical protein
LQRKNQPLLEMTKLADAAMSLGKFRAACSLDTKIADRRLDTKIADRSSVFSAIPTIRRLRGIFY